MKLRWISILLILLIAAACQQAPTGGELPTLVVLPSLTPTGDAAIAAASATPVAAETTVVPAASATPLPPAVTVAPTDEPSPQPQPTAAAVLPTLPPAGEPGTVRLATLTPVPAGENAPVRTTPQVMADLVIGELEFQRAVNQAVDTVDSIQAAEIDFVPEGLDVTLTALGGQAFVTGQVLIQIQMSGTFATFTLGSIEVNGQEAPEAFQEVVAIEFFPIVVETLDDLLTSRLGEGHDLENIVMAENEMRVFLLIPER